MCITIRWLCPGCGRFANQQTVDRCKYFDRLLHRPAGNCGRNQGLKPMYLDREQCSTHHCTTKACPFNDEYQAESRRVLAELQNEVDDLNDAPDDDEMDVDGDGADGENAKAQVEETDDDDDEQDDDDHEQDDENDGDGEQAEEADGSSIMVGPSNATANANANASTSANANANASTSTSANANTTSTAPIVRKKNPWLPEEIRLLTQYRGQGKTHEEIAELIPTHSMTSIQVKWRRIMEADRQNGEGKTAAKTRPSTKRHRSSSS